MPGDVADRNSSLHPLASVWRGLLQVRIKHPGRDGPDVPLLTFCVTQRFGNIHRTREIIIEVSQQNVPLSVREPDIEMTLRDHVHGLDRLLPVADLKARESGQSRCAKGADCQPFQKFTTMHTMLVCADCLRALTQEIFSPRLYLDLETKARAILVHATSVTRLMAMYQF